MSELKQTSGERLADYYKRIRDIARKCDYGTNEKDAIRDHLIRTMLNNRIRTKAIRQNWDLDRILTERALHEQTEEQAEAVNRKVDNEGTETAKAKMIQYRKPRSTGVGKDNMCGRCGRSNTHMHATCPAI